MIFSGAVCEANIQKSCCENDLSLNSLDKLQVRCHFLGPHGGGSYKKVGEVR